MSLTSLGCPTRAVAHFSLARRTSIRYSIISTLLVHITPLPKKEEDEAAWVDRFLLVLRYLDKDQTSTLLSLTKLADL